MEDEMMSLQCSPIYFAVGSRDFPSIFGKDTVNINIIEVMPVVGRCPF